VLIRASVADDQKFDVHAGKNKNAEVQSGIATETRKKIPRSSVPPWPMIKIRRA
jgi:hypothetical protein